MTPSASHRAFRTNETGMLQQLFIVFSNEKKKRTQFQSSCSGEVHSSQDTSKNKFYFHLKSVQITKCKFHAEHEGVETSEGLFGLSAGTWILKFWWLCFVSLVAFMLELSLWDTFDWQLLKEQGQQHQVPGDSHQCLIASFKWHH